MRPVKQKVFAYITYQRRLLVFSHPDFPEAGIQVPTGVPPLIADHDRMLPQLLKTLSLTSY